ncbi:hypothetical protein CVT24_012648 [Panaeolus cyanescens]|uniref:G domain-containing protein n=1 Tax=Panaeolus cyanescens TaxID=181874 RepID=A0A409W2G2_9AGAR|nr:hypothetical protein CVT24_012648 [Panaeolus cyanescens]
MEQENLTHELITSGTVAVEPMGDWHDEDYEPFVILLAGPTGAGKSSFIEALAGNNLLGISKDQLEGFTQTEAKRLTCDSLCLLDSPGFADANISEMEIIEQVKKWLDDACLSLVAIVLYFCPVTGTRISGTQKKTIDMLKSLLNYENGKEGALTIVTTMWDQVYSERLQKRADDNFEYIRENLFNADGAVDTVTNVTMFTNTQKSALDILNSCVNHFNLNGARWYAVDSINILKKTLRFTPYGQQLYSDLLGRIENAWLKKSSLELHLNDIQEPEMKTILEGQLQETTQTLDQFALQLAEFGSTPDGMRGLQGDLAAYFIRKYRIQLYTSLFATEIYLSQEKQGLENAMTQPWVTLHPNRKAQTEGQLEQITRNLNITQKQLAELRRRPRHVISNPQGEATASIEVPKPASPSTEPDAFTLPISSQLQLEQETMGTRVTSRSNIPRRARLLRYVLFWKNL